MNAALMNQLKAVIGSEQFKEIVKEAGMIDEEYTEVLENQMVKDIRKTATKKWFLTLKHTITSYGMKLKQRLLQVLIK